MSTTTTDICYQSSRTKNNAFRKLSSDTLEQADRK